jgi:hypothetical protein
MRTAVRDATIERNGQGHRFAPPCRTLTAAPFLSLRRESVAGFMSRRRLCVARLLQRRRAPHQRIGQLDRDLAMRSRPFAPEGRPGASSGVCAVRKASCRISSACGKSARMA